jgi:hypothetical protein
MLSLRTGFGSIVLGANGWKIDALPINSWPKGIDVDLPISIDIVVNSPIKREDFATIYGEEHMLNPSGIVTTFIKTSISDLCREVDSNYMPVYRGLVMKAILDFIARELGVAHNL